MGAMEIASEEWDGARLRVALRPVAKRDGELYVARNGRVDVVRVEGLSGERVVEA
jgi:hypothetical protein